MNKLRILIVGLGALIGCRGGRLTPDASGGGTGGTTGTAGAGGGMAPGGTGGGATGDSGTGDSGTGDSGTGDSGTGDSGSPTFCAATCDTPAGTVSTFATVQEVSSALAGIWQICACSGNVFRFINAPADAVGVEFGPAAPLANAPASSLLGKMYYLVQSSGGLVRGAGFAYQLKYEVGPDGSGGFPVTIEPLPSVSYNPPFHFSTSRREIGIDDPGSGERTILVGGSPGSTGGGGMGGGTASGGTGGGGTGGSGSPTICPATCDMPAGTVSTFATVQDVTSTLAGVWQICAGSGNTFIDAPTDAIGVEFGPAAPPANASDSTLGGNMYYLVQSSGGLVRGAGFTYQATYQVQPFGAEGFQLDIQPRPNSSFGNSVRYSPCPREFEIAYPLGDRAILVGGSPSSTGGGGTGGGAGSGGIGGGGTGGSATPPATCPSTCATPAGTVYPFATAQDATAALAGLWQICAGGSDAFNGAPANTIGVEFRPAAPVGSATIFGGSMYYLVQGSAGPVRGTGPAYQLTYDVAEGGFLQLDIIPAPNRGYGGSFRYSPCPREFEINTSSRAILVPF